MPVTDSMIMISITMKSTFTINPIGDGNGNIPISHHINPKTIRYTIKLIIKSILYPLTLSKNYYAKLLAADCGFLSYS